MKPAILLILALTPLLALWGIKTAPARSNAVLDRSTAQKRVLELRLAVAEMDNRPSMAEERRRLAKELEMEAVWDDPATGFPKGLP